MLQIMDMLFNDFNLISVAQILIGNADMLLSDHTHIRTIKVNLVVDTQIRCFNQHICITQGHLLSGAVKVVDSQIPGQIQRIASLVNQFAGV